MDFLFIFLYTNAAAEDKKEIIPIERALKTEATYIVKCRAAGICELIHLLNKSQCEAVDDLGFGGILQMKELGYISWRVMSWFWTNFNQKSRVLTFKNQKTIVVTSNDVEDIFMIPNNGPDVLLNSKEDSDIFIMIHEFKQRFDLKESGTHAQLLNILKHNNALKDGANDFKRIFIIYIMSAFLASTANQSVDFSFFKTLTNIKRVKSFNWSKFVLERMCRGFDSSSIISGCPLILIILYLQRFKWLGNAEPTDLPLIKHWSAKRIKLRLEAEKDAGHFGVGEWVEGVYPISNGRKETQTMEEQVGEEAMSAKQEAVRGRTSKETVSLPEEDCIDEEKDGVRWIKYRLPAYEKTNLEIKNVAKDRFEELLMQFDRNMKIMGSMHIKKLLDYKDKCVNRIKQREEYAVKHKSPYTFDEYYHDDIAFLSQPLIIQHIDEIVAEFVRQNKGYLSEVDLKRIAKETEDKLNKEEEKRAQELKNQEILRKMTAELERIKKDLAESECNKREELERKKHEELRNMEEHRKKNQELEIKKKEEESQRKKEQLENDRRKKEIKTKFRDDNMKKVYVKRAKKDKKDPEIPSFYLFTSSQTDSSPEQVVAAVLADIKSMGEAPGVTQVVSTDSHITGITQDSHITGMAQDSLQCTLNLAAKDLSFPESLQPIVEESEQICADPKDGEKEIRNDIYPFGRSESIAWPVQEFKTFKSEFLKKHSNTVTNLLRIEKDISDFCFSDHAPKIEDNVFAYDAELSHPNS